MRSIRWQARREGLHHLLLQLPSTRVHVPRVPYVRLQMAAVFILLRKTRPQYLWKRVILCFIYVISIYNTLFQRGKR
jgi:hypothetical protein